MPWPTPVIEHVLVDCSVDGKNWGVFIQSRIGPELVEETLWCLRRRKGDAINEASWLEDLLFNK